MVFACRHRSNTSRHSFSADTDVATDESAKDISQIQIGDYVLAWDEETNTISFYSVMDTIHHTDEVIVPPPVRLQTASGIASLEIF